MRARRVLVKPLHAVAAWVGEHPLRTAGAVAAIGALLAMAASLGVSVEGAASTAPEAALPEILDLALERPAYPIAAAVGAALFLFFDG